MDITKLLKDSDPLIVAALLNERPPKRYRMLLLWLLSLDQRNYAGNTESSKISSYVLTHLL